MEFSPRKKINSHSNAICNGLSSSSLGALCFFNSFVGVCGCVRGCMWSVWVCGCVCGLLSVICLLSFLKWLWKVGRVYWFVSLCYFLFVGKLYSSKLRFPKFSDTPFCPLLAFRLFTPLRSLFVCLFFNVFWHVYGK